MAALFAMRPLSAAAQTRWHSPPQSITAVFAFSRADAFRDPHGAFSHA